MSILNFTMKPTQTQIAFGVVAVTGVAAAGVAWFLCARKRCSAVKVADLVNYILVSWQYFAGLDYIFRLRPPMD